MKKYIKIYIIAKTLFRVSTVVFSYIYISSVFLAIPMLEMLMLTFHFTIYLFCFSIYYKLLLVIQEI